MSFFNGPCMFHAPLFMAIILDSFTYVYGIIISVEGARGTGTVALRGVVISRG
jgi:hypothetical protein